MSMPGQIAFTSDQQRTQVATRMHYDLHIGLRGILGTAVTDREKYVAEANAIIAILQAQVNTP
jgi:hypothetical protein